MQLSAIAARKAAQAQLAAQILTQQDANNSAPSSPRASTSSTTAPATKAKEKKSRTKKVKQVVEPNPSDYPTRVDTLWKIGAHVSAAGGVENAILNAAAIGYEI